MVRSIPEVWAAFKRALRGDLYVVVVILFIGFASFGLGRLSVVSESHQPVRVELSEGSTAPQAAAVVEVAERGRAPILPPTAAGQYVVSKNGTKYHFPWCPGALRMKEENKIWFDTKEAAERAGYGPAANCKGL